MKKKSTAPRRSKRKTAPKPLPIIRPQDCDPFKGRKRDISSCLQYSFGYSELRAKFCIPEIKALHRAARGPFLSWWQSGQMPDVNIFSVPLSRFAAEIGDPVNAFVWLSRFYSDPIETAERLKELRQERIDREQQVFLISKGQAAGNQ